MSNLALLYFSCLTIFLCRQSGVTPQISFSPASRGTEGLTAVLGATNLQKDSSSQKFGIAKVFIHPGYKAFSHKNDIALVKLSSSAILNDETVIPACLPKASKFNSSFFVLSKSLTFQQIVTSLSNWKREKAKQS